MFEHWYHFAPQMETQLGLTSQVMLAAHDIVSSTMGGEWIDRQAQRLDFSARSIADVHPLFRALTGGTELSIIEVCEVAAFLVAFRSDSGLGEAIVSLRDPDKYSATVTELSLAWKFKLAGSGVRLSPATERGTADFAAELDGIEHIVEVSQFANDPFRNESMAFVGAMQTALRSGLRRSGPGRHVAVEIDVRELAGNLHGDAHRAVVESLEAFVGGGAHAVVVREYTFGSVKVRQSIPGESPDTRYWSFAVCLRLVPPPSTGLLTMADLQTGEDTHWLYIRLPSTATDPYQRIRRKLSTEARQLSGCADAVILLDSGGLRQGILSNRDQRLQGIANAFESQHTSTTAFGVFAQPLKMDGTRGLTGVYFSLAPTALSTTFWNNVVNVDQRSTVLWELDQLRR